MNVENLQSLDQLVPGEALDTKSAVDTEKINVITSAISQREKTHHVYTEGLKKNGVVVQESMDKYLSSEAISSGLFKASTLRSYFFQSTEIGQQLASLKPDSKALEKGTQIHTAVLEPTAYTRLIVEPKHSRGSHDGLDSLIEYWEGQVERVYPETAQILLDKAYKSTRQDVDKLPGKKEYLSNLIEIGEFNPIDEQTFLEVEALKKSIDNYCDGMIWKLLKHSKREVSIYRTDPESKLFCKVRPDAVQFAENIGLDAILSVKTTRRSDIQDYWRYDVFGLGYDKAEAYYQDVVSAVTGRDFSTTLMIVLQTVPPYECAVLLVPEKVIKHAREQNEQRLNELVHALASGEFPGWVDGLHENGMVLPE